MIDRIGVRPQKPVGPGQHLDLTRGSVRLLETPTGPLVAWLEDGAVRAASVSAPAPARATATSVPRRSMSLDVSADGSVVAWIDGEGVPWVMSDGPSPEPCRIDARLATDRVFAGSARDAHPVLLTGRSHHAERWLLLGQDYTEQTAASGSSDGVTDAAFVGGLWMLSLDSGEVRAIPGDAGPRGNALWRSEGSSPLLVTAGWTVVEAAWQDQSGVVTVRAGANDSVLGHLRTWPVDGIAAVWQRSFFGRDLFVVCSTSRPRDVLILRLDTGPDGGFEEVVRIRQCAPRGVALAASPVHAAAALLFDDRCDLVDAANGRILTSARLDPDAAVLIEGPWGTRFLAGESVRALPRYDDWGLPLTEETARLPRRAGSGGRGDLPWRSEDHPRPAVEPLAWAGSPQADAVFGDSGRWTRSIPTLWHLFGVAGSDIHPPRAPHPNEGWDHQAAFDYWNPLLHLLLGPLGWADPCMGASRWLAADMPVTCPATRLLREWWGDDVRALEARSPAGLAAADIEDSLDLQALAPRRGRDSFIKMAPGSWMPLVEGGLDPLHLGAHAVAVMLGRPGYHEQPNYLGEPQLAFDTNRRAGALLIPTYTGWYRQLHEAAAHLESEHGPDFSIDITVRPIGWLGTYRRSPASGRWHASTERTHLMGVPEEGENDGW